MYSDFLKRIHTITETCDCEGHTASISINATSTYHDGNEHPAVVTTTGDILGSVSNVVYTYKEQKSDTEYGSMPEGTKIPKNKGFYKAVISLEGKEVSVEYEIKSPADGITIWYNDDHAGKRRILVLQIAIWNRNPVKQFS